MGPNTMSMMLILSLTIIFFICMVYKTTKNTFQTEKEILKNLLNKIKNSFF